MIMHAHTFHCLTYILYSIGIFCACLKMHTLYNYICNTTVYIVNVCMHTHLCQICKRLCILYNGLHVLRRLSNEFLV